MPHLILMITFQTWGGGGCRGVRVICHLIPSGSLTYYGPTISETSSKSLVTIYAAFPKMSRPAFVGWGQCRKRLSPRCGRPVTTESAFALSDVLKQTVF